MNFQYCFSNSDSDDDSDNNNNNVVKEYTPKDVYRLAGRKNTDKLSQALKSGNNTTNWYRDKEFGYTALHNAVENERVKCIGILIDAGVDIESRDDDGRTALNNSVHLACLGHVSTMYELLNRGADIESKDNDGRTALMKAVANDYDGCDFIDEQVACISSLLERGANIESMDNDGNTALAIAAGESSIDKCISLLLDNGANVESKNVLGNTPLLESVDQDSLTSVRILLLDGHADVESKDNEDWTALMKAASRGHLKCLTILCNMFADLNTKNNRGFNACHMAAERGETQCLQILIDRGANTNCGNINLYLPIHSAAVGGKAECIQILIPICLNIDARTTEYQTPLHLATRYGHADCIDILLINGADIEAWCVPWYNPLYIAANFGFSACVRLLLDRMCCILSKNMLERLENHECKQMILDEIQHRLRRKAFDSFIDYHIKYPLLINSIYLSCFPSGDLRPATPTIGWPRADALRNKYYFDEVLFYVHLFVANELAKKLPHKKTRSSSRRCSNIVSCLAKNNDDTSTLMTVLSDRLKMFLAPPSWT